MLGYPYGLGVQRQSAVLTLYNLKAGHQVSDVFFTELLQAVSDLLPDDNVLPRRAYDAKQMLKLIGLTHEKIHACPKDCILYRKEYADLSECPKCGTKRFNKKKSPAKVMWYFPIIPRLRRLYSSPNDAKHLTWHQDGRIKDGMLRHPADSPQWKKFDDRYPEFGKDPRNLRLVLSSDGMNPFGVQSTSHSTWPVILMIYNLAPWLCMKRRYMMLSTLIPGPRQPGNDIDVYLAPLIDDLKLLWEQGIDVYDGYKKDNFMLKAMLFGTINDFPAYGNLSGYSVKGRTACPWCTEDTDHLRLAHCKKSVYMGHRRWLEANHRYRTMSEAFNGEVEERKAPDILTGEDVLEKVENIDAQFGKNFAKTVPTKGWKKKSIFFELSYWKDLYVRHFTDLMHTEKNVCASILNTLLGDKEKSKDGYNARMDMVDLGIRGELAPVIKEGKSPYLPPAAHTLSNYEKKVLLETLQSVKVPEGYSSNIQSLVSENGLKLTSLKSHDYHVIIETLLPIAIRSILPENVRTTITKLCWFFKAMSSKVINPRRLSHYQKQIVETLCELEMYFPPFFDIMVHLTVHLVYETRMCGPGRMRWMYGSERYMKVLKGYVMTRYRPEGCMAERYLVEEALEYWSEYIPNVESIGLPTTCHTGRIDGEGVTGGKQVEITLEQRHRVHLCILHNSVDVEPFVKLHKQMMSQNHPDRDLNWIQVEHNRTFIDWFRNHISEKLLGNESVSERVKWLSRGPDTHVFSYKCYLINGYTFYTRDHDENSTMQNSGISVLGNEDENSGTTYFGQIVKIWEVDYVTFRVPVFDCSWVDIPGGVQVENNGFIRVDLNRVGFKDDSFVMATQAKQVFYVSDQVDKKWSIVILSNKSNNNYQVSDHVDEDVDAIDDPFKNMVDTPSLFLNDDAHEPLYQRLDHNEGEYVDVNEDEFVNPDFLDVHGHERETAPRNRKRKTKAKKTKKAKKKMSMTSRSRRGGESQKNNPASGSNNDQANDVHSGSQGTGTSDNSEISHPPARGIVSMLKVKRNRTKGILVKLNWNELGQPIGKESMTLAHYVGSLARRTFPITITDFRKKELAPAKEAFWDEIVANFTGLDENHKKTIISRAGCYHRVFRTRLRSLARDDNGNYSAQPPILYRELSTVTPYWNDFVEQALKEEFMEKSKKNKERAEAMEARYKSACVGYARLREKIIAERIQKGEKNPVMTRLELWEAARTNADGVVDDPEALQILEDVVQIAKTLGEDELTNIGTDDLLARAIPLEYPGRVRGYGWGVTKKSLESASQVSELAQLKKKFFSLEKEVEKMKGKVFREPASGGSSQMDNFEMDDCADPDVNFRDDLDDFRGHCDRDVDLPEGPVECYLYQQPPRRYVGKGILHNGPNETCHGVRLEAGYVRVQFEVAVEEEKDTPLPVPCDEARTVGGAPGYFLPWPKTLVSLDKPILTPKNTIKGKTNLHKEVDQSGTAKKKERTLESTGGAPQRPLGYPLPGDSSHGDVILVLLRAVIHTEIVNDIEVPIKSYFDGHSWIEHIGRENIMEILDDQWLSSSSIVLYIRYLGDVYLSKNPELDAKFSFASPHTVPPLVDISAASNYLADCLLRYVGVDHLVLMPHDVGKHWVLVAINTKTESIYYMDPAEEGRISRNQHLKQLVEHGMRAFRTRRPGTTKKALFNSFKWNNIQCPKQPDGIHCGHYVGCFIESLLINGETSIPVSFVHDQLKCYPPSKMQIFQDNWAGYLYNRFIKEKMAGN
ncbi:hypothetical protein OROMI_023705 [Orobanche minor]